MDGIYRYQRFVYDPLRKCFLVGRDRLIERLEPRPGERVLEVGCGTARNLLKLQRGHSNVALYGLDASSEMLKTAGAKLRRRGLERAIVLRRELAEDLDCRGTFGLDEPFDKIFFSYALSMMPSWRPALDAALRNLRSGGTLHVVDFWDQGGWPRWFQACVRTCLARFHVRFRPAALECLEELAAEGGFDLQLESILWRYAYCATLTKD